MAGPPAPACFTWPDPRDPGRPRSPWAPAQPDPGCRDSRPADSGRTCRRSWARPRRAGELGLVERRGSPLCAGPGPGPGPGGGGAPGRRGGLPRGGCAPLRRRAQAAGLPRGGAGPGLRLTPWSPSCGPATPPQLSPSGVTPFGRLRPASVDAGGGDFSLLVAILGESHLHTPMYFFLGNLSFLDICYTTSSIPLVLDGFLTPRKTISFSGCAMQMFLSFAMGATECVLLGMMAFDRYVAICNPLRYPVVMSKAAYVPMAVSSWVAGGANSMVQISLAVQLPFCGDNIINHFTCEILAVLKLACADISINVISMGVANVIFLGVPVLFIFVSYIFILSTILRIPSAEGRKKAFSTCSAHLTVVIVFYGTILFMYGKPKSKDPLHISIHSPHPGKGRLY
eukprot:XP_008761914.2 PREDICTED: olfactory receptor 13C7-like [Rattus norvegicus]